MYFCDKCQVIHPSVGPYADCGSVNANLGMPFNVEVRVDDHVENKAWLSVTHNYRSWSSIPIDSRYELAKIIIALLEFDASGLPNTVDEDLKET